MRKAPTAWTATTPKNLTSPLSRDMNNRFRLRQAVVFPGLLTRLGAPEIRDVDEPFFTADENQNYRRNTVTR